MSFLLAILIVLVVVLVGYYIYYQRKTPSGGGGGGGGGGGASCTNSSECQDPRQPKCIGGQCACGADSDCPATSPVCVSGKCACRANADCVDPSKPFCAEGVCSAKCQADNECPPNAPHCVGGACRECGKDADCPPSAPHCVNNACVACQSNSDCKIPTPYCVQGKCVACSQDSDCPKGQLCENGICTTLRCPSGKDSECGAGRLCSSGESIYMYFAGLCVPDEGKCAKQCLKGSDCDGNCPYCINYHCTSLPGKFGAFCPNGDATGPIASACATGYSCVDDESDDGWGCCYCLPQGYDCENDAECQDKDKSKPYCVEGTCSASAAGDYCNTSYNGKSTGCTGTDAPYCVNRQCSATAGGLGAYCLINTDCASGACTNGTCAPGGGAETFWTPPGYSGRL